MLYNEFGFSEIFWIFFIGCFLGVVVETIWCLLRNKRFESRTGLIYGPFNLVYGFGAVIMALTLFPLSAKRDLFIFLAGTLMGGVYEYLCSFVQEKCFGTVSWYYKKLPLNLHGRTNLLYCIFWGLLSLLWVKDISPDIIGFVEKIPGTIEIYLLPCCVVFMIINSAMSACVVYRMKKRMEHVPAGNSFWAYIDRHYPDERVKKIYPNMIFDLKALKQE